MNRHYHEWATKAGMDVAGSGSKVKEEAIHSAIPVENSQDARLWRSGVGGLNWGRQRAGR
jgi:hypothetical protein